MEGGLTPETSLQWSELLFGVLVFCACFVLLFSKIAHVREGKKKTLKTLKLKELVPSDLHRKKC